MRVGRCGERRCCPTVLDTCARRVLLAQDLARRAELLAPRVAHETVHYKVGALPKRLARGHLRSGGRRRSAAGPSSCRVTATAQDGLVEGELLLAGVRCRAHGGRSRLAGAGRAHQRGSVAPAPHCRPVGANLDHPAAASRKVTAHAGGRAAARGAAPLLALEFDHLVVG
eukprot:scaffold306564_cov28-Tisochrysis_lutea.AAC.2